MSFLIPSPSLYEEGDRSIGNLTFTLQNGDDKLDGNRKSKNSVKITKTMHAIMEHKYRNTSIFNYEAPKL